MKKQFRKLVCLLPLPLLFLFNTCTKSVAGPKGEPGTAGKNGNLKQTYIGPFTQPASSWSFDGSRWNSIIYVSEISSDVISKGEVRVYMLVGSEWWSLPYAVGNLFTQMSIEKGLVHLLRSKIHDGPPAQPVATNFRIVVFSPAQ